MPGRLGTALSMTVGFLAMLFVATVVVIFVFVMGLEPWQRTEALAVLRGTHRAIDTKTIGTAPPAGEMSPAELRERLRALAKEIGDHEAGLAKARASLMSEIRSSATAPPAPRPVSERARVDEMLESVKGRPTDEVAGALMTGLREGRADDVIDVVRRMPAKERLEALAFMADPADRYRRLAGTRPGDEGAASRASLDLEERSDEMRRHYRTQRGKLMLLAKEIKEREEEMESARQGLIKQLEQEEANRALRRAQAAQASRQAVLRLFGTMEVEQVAEYISRMVKEDKVAEAAGMVRSLSDRRAAEVISEIRDSTDRKKIIDEIWKSEEADVAGTS